MEKYVRKFKDVKSLAVHVFDRIMFPAMRDKDTINHWYTNSINKHHYLQGYNNKESKYRDFVQQCIKDGITSPSQVSTADKERLFRVANGMKEENIIPSRRVMYNKHFIEQEINKKEFDNFDYSDLHRSSINSLTNTEYGKLLDLRATIKDAALEKLSLNQMIDRLEIDEFKNVETKFRWYIFDIMQTVFCNSDALNYLMRQRVLNYLCNTNQAIFANDDQWEFLLPKLRGYDTLSNENDVIPTANVVFTHNNDYIPAHCVTRCNLFSTDLIDYDREPVLVPLIKKEEILLNIILNAHATQIVNRVKYCDSYMELQEIIKLFSCIKDLLLGKPTRHIAQSIYSIVETIVRSRNTSTMDGFADMVDYTTKKINGTLPMKFAGTLILEPPKKTNCLIKDMSSDDLIYSVVGLMLEQGYLRWPYMWISMCTEPTDEFMENIDFWCIIANTSLKILLAWLYDFVGYVKAHEIVIKYHCIYLQEIIPQTRALIDPEIVRQLTLINRFADAGTKLIVKIEQEGMEMLKSFHFAVTTMQKDLTLFGELSLDCQSSIHTKSNIMMDMFNTVAWKIMRHRESFYELLAITQAEPITVELC